MENKIRTFRAKVPAIFRPTITICLLGGLVLFFPFFIGGGFKFTPILLEPFLYFEAVLIPFIGLILLAVTFDYKITIYKDGISSYDPFGTKKCDFMSWNMMKKLKIRSVLGYKYFFIKSDDTNESLWIPRDIKDIEEFAEIVKSQVGIEHPLSTELMRFDT